MRPRLKRGPLTETAGVFDSFTHVNLPRTRFDDIVNKDSNKPGEQSFEVTSPHPIPTKIILFC